MYQFQTKDMFACVNQGLIVSDCVVRLELFNLRTKLKAETQYQRAPSVANIFGVAASQTALERS